MKTKQRINENIEYKINDSKIYWDLIDACNNNINDLVRSAKILLKNNLNSKSFFMSYLALEELGKRLAICDYISDIISDKELEKIFRDHNLKIAYLNNICEISEKKDGKKDFDFIITYDLNKYKKFFVQRQMSIYVDFDFNNNSIINPIESISKLDAENILNYVLNIIRETNYYEEINERIGTEAFLK